MERWVVGLILSACFQKGRGCYPSPSCSKLLGEDSVDIMNPPPLGPIPVTREKWTKVSQGWILCPPFLQSVTQSDQALTAHDGSPTRTREQKRRPQNRVAMPEQERKTSWTDNKVLITFRVPSNKDYYHKPSLFPQTYDNNYYYIKIQLSSRCWVLKADV